MKILLVRDWFGPANGDIEARHHKAGQVLSVLHWPASILLRRHGAKWLEQENGDPVWPDGVVPEPFRASAEQRAALPQVDKMMHRATINR